MPNEVISSNLPAEEILAKIRQNKEVHWYGMRVAQQHERKLVELLREKGFEAFVPVRKEKHRWSDRMKVVEQVLTNGIIFVRNSMDKKNAIFVHHNIKSYVHAPGEKSPAPISDEAMQDFMRVIDANFEFKLTLPFVGEDVMILDGALKGLVGQLVKIEGESTLVLRLNEAFGAAIRIDALSVSKVPKGTKSLPDYQVPNKV